jgi:hypothetical protein
MIKGTLVLIILLLITGVTVGCLGEKRNQTNGGNLIERRFIEGDFIISNALATSYYAYPKIFGLQTGEEYYLRYTASKYMGNIDSDMYMNVTLPDELQKISGELEWTGHDRQKTIEIKIKPVKEGDYLITAKAKNLDNNFSIVNKIAVRIRNTVEEAKNITDYGGPINPITGQVLKPGDKFEFNESILRYENTIIPLEASVGDVNTTQISANSTQSQLIQEKIKSKLIGLEITYSGKWGEIEKYTINETDIKTMNETWLDSKRVWKVRIGEGISWDYYFDEKGENIVKVEQLFRT